MLDFKESQNDFKITDLDPRELVLLYKNLLVSPQGLGAATWSKHFTTTETRFDLTRQIEQFKKE